MHDNKDCCVKHTCMLWLFEYVLSLRERSDSVETLKFMYALSPYKPVAMTSIIFKYVQALDSRAFWIKNLQSNILFYDFI